MCAHKETKETNSKERGGGLEMSFAGGRLTQNCKKILMISTCVYNFNFLVCSEDEV